MGLSSKVNVLLAVRAWRLLRILLGLVLVLFARVLRIVLFSMHVSVETLELHTIWHTIWRQTGLP